MMLPFETPLEKERKEDRRGRTEKNMKANFTENSYEQAIIALFEQMGYRYECGYDVERDPRNPLHEEVLRASLRRVNPGLTDYALGELVKQLKDYRSFDFTEYFSKIESIDLAAPRNE